MDVNDLSKEVPFPDVAMPEVRSMFNKVGAALVPLALRFLRALALSLDLDREFFAERHRLMIGKGSAAKLRSLYYPPIDGWQHRRALLSA